MKHDLVAAFWPPRPTGAPAPPLPEQRLLARRALLLKTGSAQPERSLPLGTGNRQDTEAAYNFFKNHIDKSAQFIARIKLLEATR